MLPVLNWPRAAPLLHLGRDGVPAFQGWAEPPARQHPRQNGPAGAEKIQRCPDRRPIGHAARGRPKGSQRRSSDHGW